MTVSPFDSRLFAPLLGDAEIAALFSDEAAVGAMIRVERALARVQSRVGIIPAAAAEEIDARLSEIEVDPTALAEGTAGAGVPVPALVATLRTALPPDAAGWLHWGATSQDIVDTGLVLRLDAALALLANRLDALVSTLDECAERWRDLPMAGRTRSQIAAPIAFGARCAAWAAPLRELRADLDGLRHRIARVQLGGSVGTNAVLGPQGSAVTAGLAAELGLAAAPCWHTNRTAFATLGAWCASVAGAVGKFAGDLVLMGRTESGEVTAGAAGGSSTMPQKANPVVAEVAVALARYAAPLAATMHLAALHAEERDGSAWALEWLTLPQLMLCAGSALRNGIALATTMVPQADRMRAMLALAGGAALAEAATFLLAREMPRPEAERIVKQALRLTQDEALSLAAALSKLVGDRDWHAALDPATVVSREGRTCRSGS